MKHAVSKMSVLLYALSAMAAPPVMSMTETVTSNGEATVTTMDTHHDAATDLKLRLQSLDSYRAAFSQTVTDAEGNVVHEAQGVLTMARPNKLRWETSFPDETLLIADGESVWNLDTFVEQVTILSQQQAVQDNPIMLLTAQDKETWESFIISRLDTDSEQYQVVPNTIEGQIRALTLAFNPQGQLTRLDMLDAQEQTSALEFTDIEVSVDVADSMFKVDVPESYIVDDQR